MELAIMIGIGALFVGSLAWSIKSAANKGSGCRCGCGECQAGCGGKGQGGCP